jgi:hypothetical protein
MAKQISSFYRRFILGLLVIPMCKMLGIVSPAFADSACGNWGCTEGDTRYISCGTNKLQKQICRTGTGCTYTVQDGIDCGISSPQNCRSYDVPGQKWVDSGACTTYSNECSNGQVSAPRACSDNLGTGTQTRTCVPVKAGSSTYYMWGEYGKCKYTSCAYTGDIADSGDCYCTSDCTANNGYGKMILQVRTGATCPTVSGSSSSSS